MRSVTIHLSDPVTIALAPPDVPKWGPYQFPGLFRMAEGPILAGYHIEMDSARAYGLPKGRALSEDEGRSWKALPPGDGVIGRICLPNGDVISPFRKRSIDPATVSLPPRPFAEFTNYGGCVRLYREEDMPPECAGGWRLRRLPAGSRNWQEETPVVRLPGSTRTVVSDVLTFPGFDGLDVAPDGSLWGTVYTRRIVDATARAKVSAVFLRSTDHGHHWDFWSEIPYAGDPAVDPKADERCGFTEPAIQFMPDGSVFCLLRTTDGAGVGPLYQARSTDQGRTWSRPKVFDHLGVWPRLLTLGNGVTLAAYGRPGLFVRATSSPDGSRWDPRVPIVAPKVDGQEKTTCAYAALLPLNAEAALIAYSDFYTPAADGGFRKGIRVRRIETTA